MQLTPGGTDLHLALPLEKENGSGRSACSSRLVGVLSACAVLLALIHRTLCCGWLRGGCSPRRLGLGSHRQHLHQRIGLERHYQERWLSHEHWDYKWAPLLFSDPRHGLSAVMASQPTGWSPAPMSDESLVMSAGSSVVPIPDVKRPRSGEATVSMIVETPYANTTCDVVREDSRFPRREVIWG